MKALGNVKSKKGRAQPNFEHQPSYLGEIPRPLTKAIERNEDAGAGESRERHENPAEENQAEEMSISTRSKSLDDVHKLLDEG